MHVEDLLRYRPVKAPPSKLGAIEPAVTPDSQASSVATVFEVVTQDRPGLLYHLAAAISRAGCNIEVVLVDTEAHKAIDVFHVKKEGAKLSSDDAQQLQGLLLAACVARVG
jgi:[protein-PII] uridylyltransferase